MLAPNEVVEMAKSYLGQVVPEFAALNPHVDEMVLTPESPEWRITFYAERGDTKPEPTSLAHLLQSPRIFKTVVIGATDGELIAIRNPN